MPSAELTYDALSTSPNHRPRIANQTVASPAADAPPEWGRTVLASARRWFMLPLVLGLVGAAAGLLAGLSARPSAETLLRAQSSAVDGAGIAASVNSVVLELDTADLYDEAVRSTGGTASELRDRTRISALPESQIISISVTSASPDQAVTEVNALAKAALGANESRVNSELDQLTRQTRDLVTARPLANPDAEKARLARLGDGLGANQSALTVGARQLLLIQDGQLSRMLPAPSLLAAMGLFGGVLLGVAGAMLLGTRRGTIRSADKLQQLYPRIPVVEPRDLDTLVALQPAPVSRVFLGSVGTTPDHLSATTERVRQCLESLGRKVEITTRVPTSRASEQEGRVHVVPVELSPVVLRQIARDDQSMLLVVVQTGSTRVRVLDALAGQLTDRCYLMTSLSPSWA